MTTGNVCPRCGATDHQRLGELFVCGAQLDEYEKPVLFSEELMTHGYPECGAGSVDVEALYQAFKERLLAELGVAK